MIPTFVLASASRARYQLLQQVGIDPIICKSGFDENTIQLTEPAELVETLALKKAEIVAAKFPNALVLGCDSVLALGGEIHGKPESKEEAIARWREMRGKVGFLYTGHVLIDTNRQQQVKRHGLTKVHFAPISDRLIEDYVNTSEPLECAGAFAIDGRGGLFIEKLEGCHSNVIGLSLPLLHLMLNELGYSIAKFWEDSVKF